MNKLDDKSAAFFKALSSPRRLAIVRLLTQRPSTVSDMQETFSLTQEAISDHLRPLYKARIIHYHKVGKFNMYSLNMLVMTPAQQTLIHCITSNVL